MRSLRWAVFTVVSLLALQGCGHGALEKQVDEKLARESGIQTRSDLRDELTKAIEASPGMSGEQKSRLSGLRDSTRSQLEKIRLQSLELRSVLVKDLLSSDYNEDEIELVKTRIRKLENERLAVLFRAVDQTNEIFGRESQYRRPMMDVFMSRIGNPE